MRKNGTGKLRMSPSSTAIGVGPRQGSAPSFDSSPLGIRYPEPFTCDPVTGSILLAAPAHSRPVLTPVAAEGHELEVSLTLLWRKNLGLPQHGLHHDGVEL